MAQSIVDFVGWLEKQHAGIMEHERMALECLDAGDTEGYREKMRQKAQMLMDLSDNAAPLLADLPQGGEIAKTLKRFSGSAATSLNLDSVFYMSALLYPDDYKIGEPDNLKLFIETLK